METYPAPEGHEESLHRKSLIAAIYLLRTEKENLRRLKETIRVATDGAVASLVRMWPAEESLKLGAALVILRARANWIEEQVSKTLMSCRHQARVKSAEAVQHQMDEAVKIIGKLGVDIQESVLASMLVKPVQVREEDLCSSVSVAKTYAGRWLLIAMSVAALAVREDKTLTKAPDVATDGTETNLKSIAITETSKASSAEALYQFDELYKVIKGTVLDGLIMKRWSSVLESSTCGICKGMHGETVKLDEDFTDGLLPGFVHPNCRCMAVLTMMVPTEEP